MKRFTYILLAFILTTGLCVMTGCGENNEAEKQDTEALAQEEYDSAIGIFRSSDSFAPAADYLKKWAKENKVRVEKDAEKYLVLSLPADKGYEKADPATLQMPVGSGDPALRCEELAVLLTAVKTSASHGKVRIIFTDNSDSSFKGARALDEKYITSDNFINFMYSDQPAVYNQGGAASYNRITLSSEKKVTSHDKAFRVSIRGLSGGIAGSAASAEKPNPIETLARFLAAAKTDGYVFDLASFTGGTSAGTIPRSASAVIVIPSSSAESLQKRFDTSHERFMDNYGETEPYAEYTLTQVEKPSKVFTDSTKDDIINFLYLFESETQLDKDEKTVSSSNVGAVSSDDSSFTAKVVLEDTSKEGLADSLLSLETSCSLCHMKCRTTSSNEPWITYEKSYLVSKMADLCSSEPQRTIMQNENTIFKDRNKKLVSVSFGVNLSSCKRSIKVITDYLASLNEVEEKYEK